MNGNGYTTERDIAGVLSKVFEENEDVVWDFKSPDYNYLGLSTCTTRINNRGISKIVAFHLSEGYEPPGVPVYRLHIITDELPSINGDSDAINQEQINGYAEKGIFLNKVNGKNTFKKTVDALTQNLQSVNTIDLHDLEQSLYCVIEAMYEMQRKE